MKTSKLILSVVAAAAAGVAIGILIAPEKGEELQKKITDGARGWLAELASLLGATKTATDQTKPQLEESKMNHEKV